MSSYGGQELKISKYSPADIVSQLFQWDRSAGIPALSSGGCTAGSTFLLTIPGIPDLGFVSHQEPWAGTGRGSVWPEALPPGSNNFSIWGERALAFYFTYL